jgi:hypothetical protein
MLILMNTIRFTKTAGKTDKVEFKSSDRVLTKIENPKQGILPHDFIHAIIESQLGVRGFTDLIFAGQNVEFAMSADSEAWLSESMVEAIQGMLWSGQMDLDPFNAWIKEICHQRQVSSVEVTSEQFVDLKLKIEDFTARWNGLSIGEFIEFPWPK